MWMAVRRSGFEGTANGTRRCEFIRTLNGMARRQISGLNVRMNSHLQKIFYIRQAFRLQLPALRREPRAFAQELLFGMGQHMF